MKLRNKKLNNKGFSLVELIVVVLIIAIIAVALAPQVMKWVSKSKDSVDSNNIASIKSSVNTAIAAVGELPSAELTFYVTKEGISGSEADLKTYKDELAEIFNGDFSAPSKGGSFKVTVSTTGAVTVEVNNDKPSESIVIKANSSESK